MDSVAWSCVCMCVGVESEKQVVGYIVYKIQHWMKSDCVIYLLLKPEEISLFFYFLMSDSFVTHWSLYNLRL